MKRSKWLQASSADSINHGILWGCALLCIPGVRPGGDVNEGKGAWSISIKGCSMIGGNTLPRLKGSSMGAIVSRSSGTAARCHNLDNASNAYIVYKCIGCRNTSLKCIIKRVLSSVLLSDIAIDALCALTCCRAAKKPLVRRGPRQGAPTHRAWRHTRHYHRAGGWGVDVTG